MVLPKIPGLRIDELQRLQELDIRKKLRAELPRFARGLIIGQRVNHRERLRVDAGVRITRDNGVIRLDRFVHLFENVQISVHGEAEPAVLEIGERTSIGARTVVNVGLKMTVGTFCNIAPDCNLSDGDFHDILDECGLPMFPRNKPIVIEDHVWIGVRVIVLKGVTIGTGSVIGAGSVVTRDVPPHCVAVGNPARVIRTVAGWR